MTGQPILRVENLTLGIRTEEGTIPILKGIDLQVHRGSIQGLAGESGSGKTMTGLAIVGLEPPAAVTGGKILLCDGEDRTDLLQLFGRRMAAVRGRRIGTVFQDPSTSLHPQLTVGRQLTDHVCHHLGTSKREARVEAVGWLERVGVPEPARALGRYPHEFSGGQRQRIAIAVALACSPDLLIADEPTTALDVTVQAGVLRLIRGLVDDLGLAVLFITHDMGVMSAVADNLAVMREGEIVEFGSRRQVFEAPAHPYTRRLLASLPGAKGGLASRDDLAALPAWEESDDLAGPGGVR